MKKDRRTCSTEGCHRSAYGGREKCDRCHKAIMAEVKEKLLRRYKLQRIP